MVLCGVEDGDEDADYAFCVCKGGRGEGAGGGGWGGGGAGEEGAGEIADGGYDYGEVVAAVPETVVGCLVSKYLDIVKLVGVVLAEGWRTSMRPTTIERLGI